MTGQNLRRAAQCIAEGRVEGHASDLPMMHAAWGGKQPRGGPTEFLFVPDQLAGESDVGSEGTDDWGWIAS